MGDICLYNHQILKNIIFFFFWNIPLTNLKSIDVTVISITANHKFCKLSCLCNLKQIILFFNYMDIYMTHTHDTRTSVKSEICCRISNKFTFSDKMSNGQGMTTLTPHISEILLVKWQHNSKRMSTGLLTTTPTWIHVNATLPVKWTSRATCPSQLFYRAIN